MSPTSRHIDEIEEKDPEPQNKKYELAQLRAARDRVLARFHLYKMRGETKKRFLELANALIREIMTPTIPRRTKTIKALVAGIMHDFDANQNYDELFVKLQEIAEKVGLSLEREPHDLLKNRKLKEYWILRDRFGESIKRTNDVHELAEVLALTKRVKTLDKKVVDS